MVTRRRFALLGTLLALALALAACGDDDGGGDGVAPAGNGTDGGVADDDGSGAVGICDDLGPDAYLSVELTGDVTESIDWAPEEMDCSGSAVTALTLGWTDSDLDVQLRGIPLDAGETGTAVAGMLIFNVYSSPGVATSYGTDDGACTVDITANEQANEFSYLVEGTATCPPATEVGGDGSISVDSFSFATYALA